MFAAALATALVASPGPVPPTLIRAVPEVGLVLAIGRIDEGFAARLDRTLAQDPRLRVLEIESTGGHVAPAHEAIEMVNRRSVTVRVRGTCASACALLWAGADSRELGPKAKIGLHAWRPSRSVSKPMEGFGRWWTRRRAEEIFRAAGFPEQIIRTGLDTPPSQISWSSAGELRAAGVRFRAIPKSRPQNSGQSPNNSSKPTPLRGAA